MSDKELKQEEFEATYQIQDLLGKGAFAKVNKVVNIKGNASHEYAVKIIDLKEKRKIEKRKRELRFVELEHPNIVKFFHYSFTTSIKDGGKILYPSLACSFLYLFTNICFILNFTLYLIYKHLFSAIEHCYGTMYSKLGSLDIRP